MKIDAKLINRLANSNLNLEELFILYSMVNQYNYHKKLHTWPSSTYKLTQLGLIDGDAPTKAGKAFIERYELIDNYAGVVDVEEEFEKWWKVYPSYDDHGQWERTRRIKTNKTRTRQLFQDLLKEGISPTLLTKAVEAEVNLHIKNSVKENKMTYFPNPARWLYQREFEGYEEPTEDTSIASYVEYGKKVD